MDVRHGFVRHHAPFPHFPAVPPNPPPEPARMHPHDARNRQDLVRATTHAAEEVDFLCFWGHTQKHPDTVDTSCLSNWFPASFVLEGLRYATTEHYMMAAKAYLFGDHDIHPHILASDSPAVAKKLGRKVLGFDDATWKRYRFEIVVAGNLAKFTQNPALGEFLRRTGEAVLVEAAPRDCIWGIGLGRDNTRARQPDQWRGQNLLGFALMEVRARLAATAAR